MRGVKAIGFDMDYTLAQYRINEFEGLTYKLAIGKLIDPDKFGYPAAALSGLTLDPTYMVKGLVIDKKRGNMIKADRFHYVKIAYHGFKELSPEQRRILYNAQEDRDFVEPDYGSLDTSFSIAECYLFMQLVTLKDNEDLGPKSSRSYAELYSDLRNAINSCHLDGSLKKVITADPARFLYPDPLMPQVLKALRASGKKVFLATNRFETDPRLKSPRSIPPMLQLTLNSHLFSQPACLTLPTSS